MAGATDYEDKVSAADDMLNFDGYFVIEPKAKKSQYFRWIRVKGSWRFEAAFMDHGVDVNKPLEDDDDRDNTISLKVESGNTKRTFVLVARIHQGIVSWFIQVHCKVFICFLYFTDCTADYMNFLCESLLIQSVGMSKEELKRLFEDTVENYRREIIPWYMPVRRESPEGEYVYEPARKEFPCKKDFELKDSSARESFGKVPVARTPPPMPSGSKVNGLPLKYC